MVPAVPISTGGQHVYLATTSAFCLNRWAFHGAVRAEHATVAGLGPHYDMAMFAFIIKLAGIHGHGFPLGKTAVGAYQYGAQNGNSHEIIRPEWLTGILRESPACSSFEINKAAGIPAATGFCAFMFDVELMLLVMKR
jgi:hypothetical protein